jgi:uncharacterized membrane protein YqaE (UPF0057 family)
MEWRSSLRDCWFTVAITYIRLRSLTSIEGWNKTARKHVTLALKEWEWGKSPPPLSSYLQSSTAAFKASRFRMTCDLKTAFSPTRPDSLPKITDTHRVTNQYHKSNMCGSDIFLGLVAIIFPPLAVWVKRGICSADSLINIALCSKPYMYFAIQHLSGTPLTSSK